MISEQILTEYNGKLADMLMVLLDAVHDGILVIDEHQKVIIFNVSAEKMFGYSADEVLGQSLTMLLPERVRSIHHEHVKTFDDTHNFGDILVECSRDHKRLAGMKKTGEEFPCEVSISKVKYKEDIYFMATVHDVSELAEIENINQKQQEELIKYKQSRKQELLNQVQEVKNIKSNA